MSNPSTESLAITPRARVLVVEDNEANRALVKAVLEEEGYDVTFAVDGLAGIAAFERQGADCILLDVRLPGLDGFAVCERIRALPGGDQTPILFLTALRDVDTFDRALATGGDDFVTKPFRPTELIVRVQAALKLRRMSAELKGHYALLKQQRDDLLRLQLQKERLMAFLVHDLKGPVSSMDLLAQLALRERELPERAREVVARIRTESSKLGRMIMNLLDLAKADEGQLQPQTVEVDLGALVAEVITDLRPSAQERRIELRSQLELQRLRADEDQLRRVLLNLVENAIRHAPAGTAVVVSTRLLPGAAEVRVADSGPGVPAEQRERIFEPFAQLDLGSNPSARLGRGLGLAFCKRVIEAHGGAIAVEAGNPGAVFVARLPDVH